MCEKCIAARAAAIPPAVDTLRKCPNDGGRLIGNLLSLALPGQPIDAEAIAKRIESLLLDSYEQQRSDAIGIAGWMIVRLTMIKNRLIDEALRAGDKRAVSMQYDEERKGWIVNGRGADGAQVHEFFPVAYGENPGQAMIRIGNTYLQSIGEVHHDDE